jgi:hypothetical protein
VLEPPALEIRLEFLLHVFRQRPAGGFARGEKCGVMLPDELVEQRLLGPMPRIPRRIDKRRSAPWRRTAIRHPSASLRSTMPLKLRGATRTALTRFAAKRRD